MLVAGPWRLSVLAIAGPMAGPIIRPLQSESFHITPRSQELLDEAEHLGGFLCRVGGHECYLRSYSTYAVATARACTPLHGIWRQADRLDVVPSVPIRWVFPGRPVASSAASAASAATTALFKTPCTARGLTSSCCLPKNQSVHPPPS